MSCFLYLPLHFGCECAVEQPTQKVPQLPDSSRSVLAPNRCTSGVNSHRRRTKTTGDAAYYYDHCLVGRGHGHHEGIAMALDAGVTEGRVGGALHESRGLGEQGIIGMPGALSAAFSRAAGQQINVLPITPELLWDAMSRENAV